MGQWQYESRFFGVTLDFVQNFSSKIGILSSTFLSLKSCISIFKSKWMQVHIREQLFVFTRGYKFISFSASMFLYCFSPWPYKLNVSTGSRKIIYIFSVAVHVFRNLFWKISPLFGQILITCLKCSRASFLPSLITKRWAGIDVIYFSDKCHQIYQFSTKL